ncbi:hypothetical protein FRB94_013366 [Tulasnella sp. JGI-2019a]|nr:hypothetical protein FRB94_013366 [Tulasnella sp. JGI-2019a]
MCTGGELLRNCSVMSTPGHSYSYITEKADAVSPSPISSPRVHSKYDDELVNLVVENQIYRISKILLSQSAHFAAILSSHPSGQDIPIIGVSTPELEGFLEVLHARQVEARLRLQPVEWGDALHLATKWGFSAIRKHVITEIDVQCVDQAPLDRFELALKCRVPQWLQPVYHTLCARNEHITAEEGRRLGYERLTAICRIREILRGKSKTDSTDDQCKRCDNCAYAKRLCRFPLEASGEDALEWINKVEHLEVSFREEEEEIEVIVSIPSTETAPENANKQGPKIKELMAATNVGDGIDSTLPVPLQYQTKAMQDQFDMTTEAYIEATRPQTPIIIDVGDPCISTQTATIEEPVQVMAFSEERGRMPLIVPVSQMDTQSVPDTANGIYTGSGMWRALAHLLSQSTESGGCAPWIKGPPSVMSTHGENMEPPPTMERTPLDAVQDQNSSISERRVEAIRIEDLSTFVGTSNTRRKLAKLGVALPAESALLKPPTLAEKYDETTQSNADKPEQLCDICFKPNMLETGNACEPCRGMMECVVCLRLTNAIDQATQMCTSCRNKARRAAESARIAVEAVGDYLNATLNSPAPPITATVQSTNVLRDSMTSTNHTGPWSQNLTTTLRLPFSSNTSFQTVSLKEVL